MFTSLFVMTLALVPAHAGKIPTAPPARSPSPSLALDTRDFQFPSGMRVVMQPDPTQPVVGVTMVIDRGSIADPVGKEGIAHLVEHMVFRARHGELPPVWDLLSQVGCSKNASTSSDWTDYRTACSSDMLPLMMRLESARLIAGVEGVTEAEIEAEREVVRNELRMRAENGFQAILPYTYKHIYPDGDPRGRSVIGSHDSLDNITLADVQAFVKEHYVPANVTLAVVGDFDPALSGNLIVENMDLTLLHKDLTEEHLRRYPKPDLANPDPNNPYDWVVWPNDPTKEEPLGLVALAPRSNGEPPAPPKPPTQDEIPVYDAPVAYPSLAIAWTLPGSYRNNSVALSHAARGVNNAIRRVLPEDSHRRLVGEHTSYGCSVWQGRENSVLICNVVPPAWINREVLAKKIIGQGLDAEWLVQWLAKWGKNDAIRNEILNLERAADIGDGRSVRLAHFVHDHGRTDIAAYKLNEVNQYNPRETTNIVDKWVTKKRARAIILNPMPAGDRGMSDGTYKDASAWRSLEEILEVVEVDTQVIVDQAVTPDVLKIKEKTLKNGLHVVAYQHGQIPYARLGLFAHGGSANADPLQRYVGDVFTDFERDNADRVGGRWYTSQRSEGTQRTLLTLNSHLPTAMHMLRSSVDQRGEWEQSMGTYVRDRLERMEGSVIRRGYWADWLLDQHLEADNATLWSPYHDSIQAVKDVDRGLITKWSEGVWRPDNATLVIVGNLPPNVALAEADKYFSSWEARSVTQPPVVDRKPYAAPAVNKVFVLDEPLWTQTEVQLYCAAAPGGYEAKAHRALLDSVLDDRIRALRERDGVTYGGSAWVSHWADGYNRIGMNALVQNNAAAKTLLTFQSALDEVTAGQVKPETVAAAAWMRAVMTPLGLDTQSNMSYALLEAVENDIGWDALSDYPTQLAQTSPTDLTAAIGTCVDHQVTLISGPAAVIGPQLKEAGVDFEVFDWRQEGLTVLKTISPKAAARVQKERSQITAQANN